MTTADAPRSDDAIGPLENLTTSGLHAWVDRIISLVCLATLVPLVYAGSGQLEQLNDRWLAIVGGGLVAATVLMPYYAWRSRGIKPVAASYAAFVLLGLLTWEFAWIGENTDQAPWLQSCIGLAIVCMAVATSIPASLAYAALTAVVHVVLRMSGSGGGANATLALQDSLMLVVQPVALLVALQYTRSALSVFDESLLRTQRERSRTAIEVALRDERRQLDGLVHDEVMTTLVAAAGSPAEHDPHLAAQARHALSSLSQVETAASGEGAPVLAEQVVMLLTDVVHSASPRAEVTGDVPLLPVLVPHEVVRALSQAVREGARNAERHSSAATIRVPVTITPQGRRVGVRVEVIDDGDGFDPAEVAPERLGIRVSLMARMAAVGGRATVESAAGRGTVVTLTWSGEREATEVTPPPVRRAMLDPSGHPLLSRLDLRYFVGFLFGLLALYAAVGLMSLQLQALPGLVIVAAGLTFVGAILGTWRLGRELMPPSAAWAVAGLAVLVTALCLVAAPPGRWPAHTGWFASAVMVLLITVMAGMHARVAWGAAAGHAALVGGFGLAGGILDIQMMITAVLPAGWLGLFALSLWQLDRLTGQLVAAERLSGQSAQAAAERFSKLVLREVWLTDLVAEVGPTLEKLADPSSPLTDEDRASCLVLEGGLRDGIRAANFRSPALAAAILDARRRGVSITLVDNRGSRLPETVRRAAVSHLERVVRDTPEGRIVARTAPEGYADVVTILLVRSGGSTLTTIDQSGSIATSRP